MRWIVCSLFLFLGACSGGGGGSSAIDTDTGGPDGRVVTVRPIPETNPVDPADLPLTGRASFAGELSIDMEMAGNLAGQRDTISSPVELAVDFASSVGQVTGEAAGFDGFDGRLFLTLGEIDRAAADNVPAISGRIAGTLKADADSYLIFGTFDGDFRGAARDALSGRLMGSVLNNNVQSGFDGSYQAGRLP